MSTLDSIIQKFSGSDKKLLISAINRHPSSTSGIHEGHLPFVNTAYAIDCIKEMIPDGSRKTRLLEKLGKVNKPHHSSYVICLDDKRVARQAAFSSRSRGRVCVLSMPAKVKRECGLRFEYFRDEWVKEKVYQNVELILEKVGKGTYKVSVIASFEQASKMWLFERFNTPSTQASGKRAFKRFSR